MFYYVLQDLSVSKAVCSIMIYFVRLFLWCTVTGFTQITNVIRHIHGATARFQTERHSVYGRPVTMRVGLVGSSKRVDSICPVR
jgi:hypothetical protein